MADRTLRARLVAETSGFSSRMAAAEAQLVRMERAPVVAARGMRTLESGMRVLAFQAVGLAGPLGIAATSLGSFALGGPLMLAVTAGLGAGALAARLFQKDIENLGRATHAIALDKAIGSIHAAALKLTETPLDRLKLDLERTERAIQEITRTAVPAISGGFILRPEEEQQLNQLLADRLVFQKAITQELVKQRVAANIPAEIGARLPRSALEAATLARRSQAAEGLRLGAFVPTREPGTFGPGSAGAFVQEQFLSALSDATSGVRQFATAAETSSLITQEAAASLITGVGVFVQGLIAGGGGGAGGFFGGILGLAGGLLSVARGVNPLIGAALTAGGGIIATLAAKSQRDPIGVTDARVASKLDDLGRQIQRMQQITLQLVAARGQVGETLAVIRRENALWGGELLP